MVTIGEFYQIGQYTIKLYNPIPKQLCDEKLNGRMISTIGVFYQIRQYTIKL